MLHELSHALSGAPDVSFAFEEQLTQELGRVVARRLTQAADHSELARQTTDSHGRELIKLASLAAAMADVLRRRGVKDPAASLTAEAGIAVFKIAFERWVSETSQADLPQLIRESLDELKAVTAGR